MSFKSSMNAEQRPRSGMALGGLGSGWFELRHDGRFYNWNICNNAPYGTNALLGNYAENALFFILRYEVKGEQPRTKILQIPDRHNVGSESCALFNLPWMSPVDRIEYEATFPFTKLRYVDKEMPVSVTMEAFTPFIPFDPNNSSLPAAASLSPER